MTEHLGAGYLELAPPSNPRVREGRCTRNLPTPAGKMEHLEVPHDRKGRFATE